MEEMLRYLAETQRLMAENITKLTEVQQTQNTQLSTIQDAVVKHDAEMAEYRHELAEYRQKQSELKQQQAETDQRFNVLLEEVRYLIRNLGSGGSNGSS